MLLSLELSGGVACQSRYYLETPAILPLLFQHDRLRAVLEDSPLGVPLQCAI